jgi:hypothetical protein
MNDNWLHEAQRILDKRISAKISPAKKNLYLIYYKDEQLREVESEYALIDNSGPADALLEFGVFEKFYFKEYKKIPHWGIFSWKFQQKTGLSYSQVSNYISENHDADLIYFSPPLEEELMFDNPWIQGFIAHPGFDVIINKIFKSLSIDTDYLKLVYPFDATSYCNYFYGNKKFWGSYIQFIRLVVSSVDARLNSVEREYIYSGGGVSTNAHGISSFMPFIIERFSSLYLLIMRDKLKIDKCDIRSLLNLRVSVKNNTIIDVKKALNYCVANSPQYYHLVNVFHALKKSR